MKKLLAALVFASMALTTTSAHAILIEPFIGYQTGDYKNGSGKEDISGVEYGARLGATFTMFNAGVEYSMASLEIDSSPSTDLDTTDLGIFVSFEFPILVRAYATYFLDSQGEPSGGGADIEGDGGYRLGIGFTGLPFVSLNLERILRKYDEQGSSSINVDVETTMLSVSIPLP